jgi:hypothetical protein
MPMHARAPGGATRVTASADCAPIPWPNGGGITRDLALQRAASGAPGPADAGSRIASAGDLLEFGATDPAPRAIGPVLLLEVAIRCASARTDVSGPPFSTPA